MSPHFARKPTTVDATQWHTGDEPVYDNMGNLIDTQDGDYVLRDTVTGEVESMPGSWFEANYESTDSPNTVTPPGETPSAPPAVPPTPTTDVGTAPSVPPLPDPNATPAAPPSF